MQAAARPKVDVPVHRSVVVGRRAIAETCEGVHGVAKRVDILELGEHVLDGRERRRHIAKEVDEEGKAILVVEALLQGELAEPH